MEQNFDDPQNMDNTQNMDDQSELYPQQNNGLNLNYSQISFIGNLSTINNVPASTFTIYTTETAYINRIIRENDFPYPNIEENKEIRDIPEIDIMDESHFANKKSIGDYLKNIKDVKESQFNTCRKCFKYQNKYFCKICNRNLCEDCSKECTKKNHQLIDLIQAKQGDILTARIDVTRLIEKKFKEAINEAAKAEAKEKSQKQYGLNTSTINENKEEIKENIENYTRRNDFLLIARIVLKDYTNYYHFENILSCYRYLANRFLKTLDKNCLKIIYEVEKENEKENRVIQIFHPNFVAKNKDKLTLVVNNEIPELVDKVTLGKGEDYLEVILVQKSQKDYITDLSYMFCGCTNLLDIKKHLDHKLIDFSNVKDISHMFENCVKIRNIDFDLFPNLSFDGLKMNNLFNNCKKLININSFPKVNDETLKNNLFNGCDKKMKINYNNISLDLNNNDNINLSNNDNNLSSHENNSNIELSHSKEIKFIENEKKIKQLEEKVKLLEANQKKYEEIEQNEKNKETLNSLLKKKDFEKAFEIAIKIGSIENIINVIKNYYFTYNKEGKDLSKNILANIMRILCENILSCENLGLVVKFILNHICKKNISFDNGLNKVIYDTFFDLSTNGEELNLLNIKKDDMLQIVNFFKNKI